MSLGENPIQERAKAQLEKNLYFTAPKAIPIITVDQGDIGDLILRKIMAPTEGLCVTILTPTGRNLDPKVQAVMLENDLEITVAESIHINRGAGGIQKAAYAVARQIMRNWNATGQGGLHWWQPGPPYGRLEFEDYDEVGAKIKGTSVLMYRLIFGVKEAIT